MTPLTRYQETLLCGREKEIGEIVENCRQRRLTVVSSPPGYGVTSLFEAGIAPALQREGFIVVIFRDWQGKNFADHLREALEYAVREQAESHVSARGESLGVMLRQVRERSGKPVAVLFDQFEDYLRCQTAEAFDAELAQVLTRRDAAFVIGMQAIAVPAFERLKQYIPGLLGNHIRLEPLSLEAAKEAVEREALAAGWELTPAALEALLSAPVVNRENGLHPFFLKVATAQLFEAAARIKAPAIDIGMIEVRNGIDRIVFECLDGAIDGLNPSHLEIFFRWCNILISPDIHRLALTEKGLTNYAGKLNRFVPSLLPVVLGARLMRPVETPDAIRYEIARECLTPIVSDWRQRRESVFQARQRANFRIRSISIAVACFVVMYVVWIVLSWNDAS